MLLILVSKETNRLRYTMQLMLTRLLEIEYTFTTDIAEYIIYNGPRFSYGVPVDDQSLFFGSCGLLFETKISSKEPHFFEYEGNAAFFAVGSKFSALPFDVFAASFYLVSRYEEYLPHLRDSHNRYLAHGSDAFNHGFLLKPLVNIWSLKLKDILHSYFPDIIIKTPTFKFLPTIDVDAAYLYKNKGLTRAIGGLIKALQNKNYGEFSQRVRVLLGLAQDPHDTFAFQLDMEQKYHYKPTYFFLLADYGPNDKNNPYNNRNFQRIIKLISDYAEIGIHPSYASSSSKEMLSREIARLSQILKRDVEISRQHFLKLNLPDTYRNLILNDITHDFTMGYAETTGFRASICTSYSFYDLDQDVPTNLMIHPFAVMDGTLNYYLNLTPEQATKVIYGLIREVKKVGGTFIPLWHNHSLNDQGEWKGLIDVYIKMVEFALEV